MTKRKEGPFDRVQFHGEPVTRRQRQALVYVENAIKAETKWHQFEFWVPQGSWQPQTSYSGTAHTGAGVVDLEYEGMGYSNAEQREKYRTVLRYLRGVGGQAAMGRGPWNAQIDGTGGMPYHYHTCDLDTTGQAETVRNFQVPQYRDGYDGLYYNHKDPFVYRPTPIRKWRFRA